MSGDIDGGPVFELPSHCASEDTTSEKKNKLWLGVLIEESLEDPLVLKKTRIVRTENARLEEEGQGQQLRLHKIEVSESDVEEICFEISKVIRPTWYFHIVSGSKMIVVFRDEILRAEKSDPESIERIIKYGTTHGVLPEQIELHRLIDNPYDE